jgi:transcriptional regulator with XRE-family HTH domain
MRLLMASRKRANHGETEWRLDIILRRQREERGMTLTELARRVEISIAYLSRIERERENPPPDYLISALAGALSPVWASLYRGLAVSFQQIVHPVLTEETEVAEASDSEGKPDEHA